MRGGAGKGREVAHQAGHLCGYLGVHFLSSDEGVRPPDLDWSLITSRISKDICKC